MRLFNRISTKKVPNGTREEETNRARETSRVLQRSSSIPNDDKYVYRYVCRRFRNRKTGIKTQRAKRKIDTFGSRARPRHDQREFSISSAAKRPSGRFSQDRWQLYRVSSRVIDPTTLRVFLSREISSVYIFFSFLFLFLFPFSLFPRRASRLRPPVG